ncbi:MAG: DUF5685 family protein [Bacillota bacterium]|nr:DUF5685 family protein [Bacillota bacterium]
MFGYIKPCKPEMRYKEFELYKAVYCGLCKQLKKDFGMFASLILSYDCTFLALNALALSETAPKAGVERCKANPIKKCNFCEDRDDSLKMAAAFSVLSAYYKLKDDLQDENFFKKVAVLLAFPFVSHWRKKALKNYEQIDIILQKMQQSQDALEKDKDICIDAACDPTAQMLGKTMCLLSKDEKHEKIFYEYGYFLGRWIYLIDAADDIEKDKKCNRFNPLIVPTENITNEERSNYINEMLNASVARMISAFNLIDFKFYNNILENIILLGLPEMQKNVLFKTVKKRG